MHKNILIAGCGMLIGLSIATASSAQTTVQYFKVQSGTGFYVNSQYIITNSHVINGCSNVTIKGMEGEHTAQVAVNDTEHDLALLQTIFPPENFAPLRYNVDNLKPGDKVYVIGYPGEAGLHGEYHVATAQIQNIAPDAGGNPERFYIDDVVQHGNSGGPVFDTSGNVIGVVVAKTVFYTINRVTQEKLSEQPLGVVITLKTLNHFLQDHGIYTQESGSVLEYGDSYIEDQAKRYIVNVQCRMPGTAADMQQNPEPQRQ